MIDFSRCIFVTLVLFIASLISQAAIAKFKDVVPSSDTHIASGVPSTVLSGGTNTSVFLQKGSAGSSFGDEHTWLQFNLTDQIPSTASVSKATVRFYIHFDQNFNGDLPITALGVADNWDETNLTWDSSLLINVLDSTPATGNTTSTVTLEQGQRFRWYELDVTDFVVDQLTNDPTKIVSIALELQSGLPVPAQDISFRANSKDYDPGDFVHGTLAPRLRLEYTGNWPSSANDVTIIHTNDIHSRINTHELDFPDADGEAPSMEEAGGAQYVAAKVLELKLANPNALILDAGDISEGSPLGDLRGNGGTVDFFQILNDSLVALGGRGIDGIVVGNHDVREEAMLDNMRDPDGDGLINGWVDTNNDDIYDTFNPPALTDPTDVPYLAVNLLTKNAAVPAPAKWPITHPYRPYNLITMPDGTNVAILGYITDDSAILTAETVNLIEVKETIWSDSDPNTVDIKDWVEHLRNTENADIVVLLSHIGHRRLNATTQPLLGAGGDVTPPDVVVSGHWHTWTKTAWQPSNLNYQTTNVEAASYGQYVGELHISPKGRYLSSTKHAMKVGSISIPPSGPVKTVFDDVVALLGTLETEYNNQGPADAEHDPCILVESGALTEAQVQATLPTFSTGDNCPLNLVVGQSNVDLSLDKDKWNTLSEFPWSGDNTAGGWITDGMVWKVNGLGLNADLAFQSGGGIRRDLAAGNLTYREIYEAYPWDDDGMVRVQMNSMQVIDYIEDKFVGASISSAWQVTATDGRVDSVKVDTDNNGSYETTLSRTDTTTLWDVIISEYMYQNDDWISESGGTNNTFQSIDPTPEYLKADGTTSVTPSSDPLEIRNSVIEYTQANSPIDVVSPRYVLNTEIAGEFEAVITMLNDAEEQPYFEAAFVRLLKPTAETIARRNLPGDEWGLDGFINSDGSFVDGHEFRETMLYRSHLGFPDGFLKVGDRLIINGEFGFFSGNPQFVDQEGITSAEEEFDILGNDPSLAMPDFMQTANSFMNSETLENHLVKLYVERLSDNTFRDAEGTVVTAYREGGFFTSTYLNGSDGDCIIVTGVQTHRAGGSPERRFRLRDSQFVSNDPETCFPPSSTASVSGTAEVGSTLTLSATASDLNGFAANGGNIGSFVEFQNIQGSSFFAGMDLDGDGEAGVQFLEFTGINISGETGLSFSAYFAEDDDGANQDWDAGDYVKVQYRVDSGLSTNLFAIENDGASFNGAPLVDTDFNGVGDGTEITDTFVQFNANIADTGSLLDLRFEVALGAGDEDIAFDNVTLSANSGTLMIEDFEDAVVNYTISPAAAEYTDGAGDYFVRVLPAILTGGNVAQIAFYYKLDGGPAQLISTDTDGNDGWSASFIPAVGGNYEFYSVATDNDGNVEWAPIYADQSVDVPVVQEDDTDEDIPFLPIWALWGLIALFGLIGIRLKK